MIYFLIIFVGIFAGVLGAFLGIGGGIIMLPATHLLMGFDTAKAVGTTLFAVIFTSVSGAYAHYRRGNVITKTAILTGTGGIIGVLIGSYIFKDYLSNNIRILEILLGILFLVMALKMGRESYREFRERNSNSVVGTRNTPAWAPVLLGFITGILTGILGLGGGFIMVPAMIWFFFMKPYEAVGTTLLAMLPIAALGGSLKVYHGFVDLPSGLILGIGTIIGTQLGINISRMINQVVIKIMFTCIFAYLAVNYLLIL